MNTKFVASALVSVGFFSTLGFAHAATLSFGGARTVEKGSTITIPVLVTTAGSESMNAVAATVRFPIDKLRAISISESGIIDLWAEKPTFSNTQGTATFQGITYNPGYSGVGGRVLAITFRALEEGESELSFSGRSILANDGEGTEILTGSGNARISITAAANQAEVKQVNSDAASKEDTASAVAESQIAEEISTTSLPTSSASQERQYVFNLSIPYGFFVDAVQIVAAWMPFVLVFVGLAGWIFFAIWYGWYRFHHMRRSLLRRIAITDSELHSELKELHDALIDEVKRLREKQDHGTITAEERHILSRFSAVLQNVAQVKSWHLEVPQSKRKKRDS